MTVKRKEELWRLVHQDAKDAKVCRERQQKILLREDNAAIVEANRLASIAMTWETAMLIGLRRLSQTGALEGELSRVFQLHEQAAERWSRDEEGADEDMNIVRSQ